MCSGIFWPLQHPQQLGLVGLPPRPKAVKRGPAGAASEDAVEPRPQRETTAVVRAGLIHLEIGVEVPDQLAPLVSGSPCRSVTVSSLDLPLRMDPAQGVPANGELSGIIAEHHGITPEVVGVDAAPDGAFRGDLYGVGCRGQCAKAAPVAVC